MLGLEKCNCGFGQLPAPLVAGARAAAPYVPSAAKQVTASIRAKADAEARKVFRSMGVPDLPYALPSELSVKGVGQAAYDTGKVFAEKRILEATGVPVKLPAKLTAKELARSVGAIIPTDVEGLLDTALAAGAQAAAGAVTAALVGAGIGSVVPGLGTVLGIGAALGVTALKGAVKKLLTKRGRKCNTPWTCPSVPTQLSMIEILPWIVGPYVAVDAAIRREEGPSKLVRLPSGAVARSGSEECVRGPTVDCRAFLSQLALMIFERGIDKTPSAMGLPQVLRLIPMYEATLAQWRAAGLGDRGLATGGTASMLSVLEALRRRKADLTSLLDAANRELSTGRRPDTMVRFRMVEALQAAAVQAELAPGADTAAWFRDVARYVSALTEADAKVQRAMHEKLAVQRQRGEARLHTDPTARAAHERQILAFQRSEQQRPAAPPTADGGKICATLYEQWRADPKNAAQVRCLGPADIAEITRLCLEAHGVRRITPETALQMIGRTIAAACARANRPQAPLRGLGESVYVAERGHLVSRRVSPYPQPVVRYA